MTTIKTEIVGQDYLIRKDTVFFFDMDGTLVDTDYSNNVAYLDAIQKVLGLSNIIKLEPHLRLTRTVIAKLMPYLNQFELQQIITMKEVFYKNYLSHTTLIPVVVDLLKKYYQTHRVVLVTKSCEDRTNLTLKYHGLESYFEEVIFQGLSNPTKNKYAYAINKLKITPEKIIAFENERSEINNAIVAGILSTNILSPDDINQNTYEAVYN
ncbi:beta-phosphoglucomutase-like phosphatase (HAD superfamily) [Mangrovibacterium marinum]|uniref:phosphoglycolate phosphatase n=1 Tax=Mangrovibacterium marinum TaxID=1639118 RepID=A0A2T5C3H0_9BACT|nr:HAD hydrolase-like protein [Mangrovibacterium marinum]PTN09294.1 beta-phosphoglucomutase-like phosphatase (HAD superfamily) [Mangrovibacterium marinum]